ncbi:hypothetical protein EXIGLDRAFT_834736 [Exidia glandulosa HHB12029]|uniref:Uncharacterized protein n=1 Tax=Exidia glandulosa HHB12029 TaxID=1314781 RepID=A0A166ASH7_EXIGL|nr:hypothetical protein EXIGLDRAFT_834736 [Exidia glandulosa HHB12029]
MFFVTTPRFSTKSSTSKLYAQSSTYIIPLFAQSTTALRSKLRFIPTLSKIFDSNSPKKKRQSDSGILRRQTSDSSISSSSDSSTRKSVRFSDCTKSFDAVDDPSIDISRPRGMRKHMGFPVLERQSSDSTVSSSSDSSTRKSVRFSDCTKKFDAVNDPSIDISRPRGMRKHMGFPVPGSASWFHAHRTGKYQSCHASVNRRIKLARSQSEPLTVARPLGIPRPIAVRAQSAPARISGYEEYPLPRDEHARAIAELHALI